VREDLGVATNRVIKQETIEAAVVVRGATASLAENEETLSVVLVELTQLMIV
jgi:hypothetical protein